MTTSTAMTPRPATSALKAAGLTATEVARLVEARTRYTPYREFFSAREFQRLSFLRWRVENGLVPR